MSSAFAEFPADEAPSQRAVNPALPPLPPADRGLFRLLVSHRGDLPTLAKAAGRDLIDLIEWAYGPTIQAWLAAYHEIHEQCSRLQAYSLLSTATDALVKTINTSTDPVELRRAACFLVHASAAVPTFKPLSLSPSSPSAGGAEARRGGPGSVSSRPAQPPRTTTPDHPRVRPVDPRADGGSAPPSSIPPLPTIAPSRAAPSTSPTIDPAPPAPVRHNQSSPSHRVTASPSQSVLPSPSHRITVSPHHSLRPSLLAAAAGAAGPAP